MRIAKTMLSVALLLFAFSEPALAGGGHRPHVRFGLVIASPVLLAPAFYAPHYYYPRYYSAPVYVERRFARPHRHGWHYCPSAGGYYPYVKVCPGGWQRVVPRPPPG